jgi:hypothetical protein
MEHRWGRRQSTDVRVRFVSQAKIGTGCLSNVSVTGAFMKTQVHLRLLSVLNLSSASHSRKARGKGVAAFVVRQDATGVGLEWCEAGQISIEARLALLAGYAAPTSRSAAARLSGECLPRRVASSTPVETEKTSGRMTLKFLSRHTD